MTLESYLESCGPGKPEPKNLSSALRALWWDKMGDWQQAHAMSQEGDPLEGAWVHAYLHRKEGDIGNARYWYSRAGKSESQESLESEWNSIVAELLAV